VYLAAKTAVLKKKLELLLFLLMRHEALQKAVIQVAIMLCNGVSTTSQQQPKPWCVICKRNEYRLTRHHLYPRGTHSTMIKKGVTKKKLLRTIPLCGSCHGRIHQFFSNTELSANYFTLDRLMSNEKIYRLRLKAESGADETISSQNEPSRSSLGLSLTLGS
jgi:hypothetical protein